MQQLRVQCHSFKQLSNAAQGNLVRVHVHSLHVQHWQGMLLPTAVGFSYAALVALMLWTLRSKQMKQCDSGQRAAPNSTDELCSLVIFANAKPNHQTHNLKLHQDNISRPAKPDIMQSSNP